MVTSILDIQLEIRTGHAGQPDVENQEFVSPAAVDARKDRRDLGQLI
jgi:hypothetical protein